MQEEMLARQRTGRPGLTLRGQNRRRGGTSPVLSQAGDALTRIHGHVRAVPALCTRTPCSDGLAPVPRCIPRATARP